MRRHLAAAIQHGLRWPATPIAMSVGDHEFVTQFLLLAAIPGGNYLFWRQVGAISRAPTSRALTW